MELEEQKWKSDVIFVPEMWEMLNLSKLIFCVVLGVQMCIFCCRVQFSSHPPGGPGSALQQSHVFFTSLLILSASLPLMFSTPALYRKEQSAGQHWLLEHVALFMSLLEKRFRWRTASAWPEFYLIQSRLSPNLFFAKVIFWHIKWSNSSGHTAHESQVYVVKAALWGKA